MPSRRPERIPPSMAEPPSTVPAEVATSGQDVLLTTKLHVPRPQPGFAVRPRLLRRLDEGLTRGLVLVCAPAGFGKSALLADWAHRQRRPVAWLSLDAGDNDPLNPVPARRARLLLAQGDVTAAVRWAQDRGLGPDDEPVRQREPEYLVLARALLARDLPDQALRLLTKLLPRATAQSRTGDVIELRPLEALALAAGGEEAAAQAALAEALALALASRQGHVRVFADEGAPMGALLDRLRAAQRARQPAAGGVPAQHLARVLEALRPAQALPRPGRGATAAVPGLIEP
jgi:hypothetical protein